MCKDLYTQFCDSVTYNNKVLKIAYVVSNKDGCIMVLMSLKLILRDLARNKCLLNRGGKNIIKQYTVL